MEDASTRLRLARHLHVQAGVDEVDGMNRAPVRGHESLEAELVAQDFGERGLVAAGKSSVEAVVGAHDRRDAGLDSRVEGRNVDLVQRLVVDPDVAAVGVIAHEVLDLGHDMLRLDSLDLAAPISPVRNGSSPKVL